MTAFIVAEVQKQNVPLTIVLKQEEAQYVLTGVTQEVHGSWAGRVFGGGSYKSEASVNILTADGKSLVWSGDAGKHGGQREIAGRIVKKLKADLFPASAKK